MLQNLYQRASAFFPSRWVEAFKRELDYLGIGINERRVVGFLVVFAVCLGASTSVLLYYVLRFPIFASLPLIVLGIIGGSYLVISIKTDSKGKEVDAILPDALQLIASNVRSGLTTERALLASARPEFGVLEKELKNASKRILTGEKVEIALQDMCRKIKSGTLEKTIWIINKGISSGGQIGDLLTQLSSDLREQNALQAEVRANVSMYKIMIFFAACVGAPMLLGISSFIVQILSKQMSMFSGQELSGLPSGPSSSFIGVPKAAISPEFVFLFALIVLVVTALSSCMTIGIINEGKEKAGVKYIPLILPAALGIFFAIRAMLEAMFGQLI